MTNFNVLLAKQIVERLAAFGVREFCICAGARNAPIVAQLFATEGVRIFSFFEERSAAFFALGRIRETARPVAVVMTSGTAVAEGLPAVIEGYYQGLPLVILSADRPRGYRGTGAPQAIEQVGMFTDYVEYCLDVASIEEDWSMSDWTLRRPLHLNVCFEEPKATDVFEKIAVGKSQDVKMRALSQERFHDREISLTGFSNEVSGRTTNSGAHENHSDLQDLQRPVAILGPLQEFEKPFVLRFLEENRIPFVAEAPSALPLSPALLERRIFCPDKTLPRAFASGQLQSVIRLGGVPTLRFWRDLEEKFSSVPVVSVSDLDFSGLARASRVVRGFANLENLKLPPQADFDLKEDRDLFQGLLSLIKKYPRSEAALVRKFVEYSSGSFIYLGNSLPIREWDLVSPDLAFQNVWANRGANGIDGQISSFLGWTADIGKPATALIGDLTALYDMASPWISSQLQDRARRLVIINNFGGQIFRPMFQNPKFLNSHEIGFQKWAEMWNWNYTASADGEVLKNPAKGFELIELRPDQQSSDSFNQEWKAL